MKKRPYEIGEKTQLIGKISKELKEGKLVFTFIIYRHTHKYISFPNFYLPGNLYRYFITNHRIPGIFKDILHIHIKFNGKKESISAGNIYQSIGRAMPQKIIIDKDVQISSP